MFEIAITVNGRTEKYFTENLPVTISHSREVLVVIREAAPQSVRADVCLVCENYQSCPGVNLAPDEWRCALRTRLKVESVKDRQTIFEMTCNDVLGLLQAIEATQQAFAQPTGGYMCHFCGLPSGNKPYHILCAPAASG